MIECKMGISADTLVLVHSSSKVCDEKISLIRVKFMKVYGAAHTV